MLYTSEELRSFNRDLRPPTRRTRKTLFRLRLWLPRTARSVCFVDRQSTDPVPGPSHVTLGDKHKQLSFATWNSRSLGNKYLSVSDFIASNDLDLFCLTESWHKDSSDVAVLRSIPAGYRCIDVPREAPVSARASRGFNPDAAPRGGGIILYFRDHFVVKKIDVVVGLKTFEYVCVSLSTPVAPSRSSLSIDLDLSNPMHRFCRNSPHCWRRWQHTILNSSSQEI